VKLDVVVPTYNRSGLLRRTVDSLFRAPIPAGLEVTILVVDNNSKDDTEQVVRSLAEGAPVPLRYVRETRQGLSHARNGGIAAGTGDLIGLIDDDEEIDTGWYEAVAREFADPATDFIGGPYLANCEVPMPSWIPSGYNGVIGIIPARPRTVMAPPFPGNLPGGNAVLRRATFDRVGLYDGRLGRSGKGLLSEEDADLYRRLLSAGMHGYHVPDLAIHHHIPASRLTRSYYRRWCYWRGVSLGVADRTTKENTPYLLGVPRYRVKQALLGLFALPRNLSATSGSGEPFTQELALWDLLGFVYGKYFVAIDRFYKDAKK
jgi:glycosyltransferase involved in cell wall biosynthesis